MGRTRHCFASIVQSAGVLGNEAANTTERSCVTVRISVELHIALLSKDCLDRAFGWSAWQKTLELLQNSIILKSTPRDNWLLLECAIEISFGLHIINRVATDEPVRKKFYCKLKQKSVVSWCAFKDKCLGR